MSPRAHRAKLSVLWADQPPDESTAASLRALGIREVLAAAGSAHPPHADADASVRWSPGPDGGMETLAGESWTATDGLAGSSALDLLRLDSLAIVTYGAPQDRLRQCRRIVLDGLSGAVALASIPQRPICSDDLAIDAPIELGRVVLETSDIIQFAEQWDPLDMHIDEEWADSTPIGGLCASGVHLMSLAQRAMSEHFLRHVAIVAGRGLREMRILRPGRPGDELSVRVTVREVVQREHGRDLVTTSVWMGDDAGPVLTFTGESVVLRRSALQTVVV